MTHVRTNLREAAMSYLTALITALLFIYVGTVLFGLSGSNATIFGIACVTRL
jgi:hypothetical protein